MTASTSSHATFGANPLATTSTSSPRQGPPSSEPRLKPRNETVTEQNAPEVMQRKTVEEKESAKKPRRLSFVEGTSIIENINHLVSIQSLAKNWRTSVYWVAPSAAMRVLDLDIGFWCREPAYTKLLVNADVPVRRLAVCFVS